MIWKHGPSLASKLGSHLSGADIFAKNKLVSHLRTSMRLSAARHVSYEVAASSMKDSYHNECGNRIVEVKSCSSSSLLLS